jgi:hypothetical protein
LAAAAASALALCTYTVRAEDPAPTTTSTEIQALRARLDQLEAQQKQAEQQRHEAEQKLDEKITSEQLDKETTEKSQFISAEGFTAGYSDNRFVIQSDDGNFKLRPWFHLQIRGVANDRQGFQNGNKNPEDEWNTGFEIRRMRFGFDGNAFSPDFQYFFNWTTNRTSGNTNVTSTTGTTKGTVIGTASNGQGGVPILEEAWIKYHIPTTPLIFQLGQQHDPILHEEMTSSRYRHSAEISLTSDIFVNGDAFTEAAMLIYDNGPDSPVRAEAGINHGIRSANTNFESYPNNGGFNQFNYGFAGRVEYKVMGRWKDYAQIAQIDVKDPLLVFGVGGDYSERGHDGQVVGGVDGQYSDPNGVLVYGEVVDRYTTHNFGYFTQSSQGASLNAGDPAVAGTATNEYSFLLEGGYLIANRYEPFLRYEYMKLQGTPAGSRNYIQDVTTGVNVWFQGHRLKLTGEVMYLPQGLPFDDSPTDEFASPHHGELVYEMQLQLLI